jgi:hypothetical protein
MSDRTQEAVDRFYWTHGAPCCAGCDWWQHLNALVGKCRKSAPVSSKDRWAMMGITGSSLATGAGHVATLRDHSCGQFRDSFDWSSLPPAQQRRIGVSQKDPRA